MSVRVTPAPNGSWKVEISFRRPDGTRDRDRKQVRLSKSAAKRWGEEREHWLSLHGRPQPKKEVPTLEEFSSRFIEGYAKANQHKPSGVASKESILRVHLLPALGRKRLNAVTSEDVQQLKLRLITRSAKTVNNVLTVLNTLMKVAVEWDVIERLSCSVRLVKTPKSSAPFHDFDDYRRLVAAAGDLGARTRLIVVLGGQAGLRCGEMMALEWTDVDFANRQLRIERSDWKGYVTSTKGGRGRIVEMTDQLCQALRTARSLRSSRVVCQGSGAPLTQKMLQSEVRRAARRAGVTHEGVHVLRHTFCSHLAMRGASTRAIQELAGHQNISTTQRYMHLSPAARGAAIRLLDEAPASATRGEIGATRGDGR